MTSISVESVQPNLLSNKKEEVIYFKNLDVLRFVAAFMVVIAHGYEGFHGWIGLPSFFRVASEDVKTPNAIGKFFTQMFQNFGFGVDIFFLISGFLITYLLLAEKEKSGGISIRKFFVRRGLRIWPLYYLIVISAPFLIYFMNYIRLQWMNQIPSPNYSWYYFLIGNFDVIKTGQWMYPFAHLWSICIEEHFYILWPFVIAFVPKKYLMNLFILMISASVIARVCYFVFDPEHAWFQIYLNTLCRIDVIIIGAIVALIHHNKPINLKVSKTIRIIALIGFIWVLGVEPIVQWDTIFLAGVKKYFYILWVGFLLINFLFNEKPLLEFKNKGIFHYLGKISYGIYIYHNILVGIVIDNILLRYGPERISFGLFFLIYFSLTIVVSIISWEIFEKHILKLKGRFEVVRTTR